MNYPDAKGYYELSSPSPGNPRKRSKHSSEDLIPAPDKRELRRKRERDRAGATMTSYPEGMSDANLDTQDPDSGGAASATTRRKGGGKRVSLDNLPPEEAQKKQRIREAARERQRKHRAGVKAKRMAELGMAIVNEGGGIEQTAIGYTINENGQYEAVLADPSDPNPQVAPVPFPVSQVYATPSQMFASTLLLGLSCTPHLKQQLLRALRSTNEDLAAFEPVIAAAFDHWNHGRSLHYAAQSNHAFVQLPPHTAYPQIYPPFGERFQRPPVAASPASAQYGRDQSLSPSEESYHANGESDAQIEPEPSQRRQDTSPDPSRNPGQSEATTSVDEVQGESDGGSEANVGERRV